MLLRHSTLINGKSWDWIDLPVTFCAFLRPTFMKATTYLLLATAVIFSSCSQSKIKASKELETKRIELNGIEGIDVHHAFKVDVYYDSVEYAVVETNTNLLPYISTEMDGAELEIRMNKRVRVKGNATFHVSVYGPNVRSFDVNGASQVRAHDVIRGEHISLDLSGASKFSGEVQGEHLTADLSGASKAKVSGELNHLTVDLSGASKWDGYKVKALNVQADLSGASSARVQSIRTLQGETSGASNLSYMGSPAEKTLSTSGASSIKKRD